MAQGEVLAQRWGCLIIRSGKGKPMGVQAKAMLKSCLSLTSRHAAKQAANIKGTASTGKIHSLGTFHKYVSALKLAGEWAREQTGLRYLREFTPDLAQQYLAHRVENGIGQKQLDADRNALAFIVGRGVLVREHTLATLDQSSKAYTSTQVQFIVQHQGARNAFSTVLVQHAGLRAHELLTLRRTNEMTASPHRDWHSERFLGREGHRYVVTGKGGLRREIIIPEKLSQQLETCRLATPQPIQDRGINYLQHYDIAGGSAWSSSFSDASIRALGWSYGGHGLRHSYAQVRMGELFRCGKDYWEAREIISQELGHFRDEIVEVYLR